MPTSFADGSQTCVINTEHFVSSPNVAGVFHMEYDLSALAAGDVLEGSSGRCSMADDLEAPGAGLTPLDQERAGRALRTWYETGSYYRVRQELGVDMEGAVNLVEEGRRLFELQMFRDVHGQRVQTALELSQTNEFLLDHLKAARARGGGARSIDIRVADAQQRTRERLNQVTGVEEQQKAGPAIVILGHGFVGSEEEALEARRIRPGDALVIETREPWARAPEVVDGEAEEVPDDG